MSAWVLWHRYGDGSGAHIERVYFDEIRAREDYELLTKDPPASPGVKAGASEWHLDGAPVFGPTLVTAYEGR